MNSDPTSLDRLHDIIAPPPVPWWPPAIGWYWAIGLASVILFVLIVGAILRWQRNRYRREALLELERQERALANPEKRAATLAAMAALLKRTALSAFPRDQVAALTGRGWFEFLDRATANTTFSAGEGKLLEDATYDSRTAGALNETRARQLAASIRYWIRRHSTR